MTAFEPGEGFREVEREEAMRAKTATLILDDLDRKRYWVREEPVPALPTTPQTVIRAHWGSALWTDLWLTPAGSWVSALGSIYDKSDMAQLERFEVLAQPIAALVREDEEAIQIERRRERDQVRHETAKAVIDRVQLEMADIPFARLRVPDIARAFGVSL